MKPQIEVYFPTNPNEAHFSIAMCGKQIAEKGHAVPPRVYPNHNFSFILKGCGTFHSRFGDHHIKPGNGYFIEGGSTVSYEADSEDPWEYVFVNFRGDWCDGFLELCGISAEHPVFSFPLNEGMLRILNELLHASCESRSAGFDTWGYFFILLAKLIASTGSVTVDDASARRTQDMVRYIESNFDRNITVQELSKRFFIDRSGIYRFFKRDFGISPKAYILRCRLNYAIQRLREEDVGITEIALSCGFFDRAHFNKRFAEFYGMTPGEYRLLHRQPPDAAAIDEGTEFRDAGP